MNLKHAVSFVSKGLLALVGLIVCMTLTWVVIGLGVRFYNAFLSEYLSPIIAICLGVVLWFSWIIFRMIRAEETKSKGNS